MIDETKEQSAPDSVTISPGQTDSNGSVSADSSAETSLVPSAAIAEQPQTEAPREASQAPPKRTPPPPPPPPSDEDEDEGDDEERVMLRMSFMEHLEELRSRLLRAILGLVVAFVLCIGFCKELWEVV